MKLLIPADGDSPDSLVARRFGNAAWYFLIDSDSFAWTALRCTRDSGSIFRWAYEAGAKRVVVGHPDPRLMASCRAFGFECSRARSISVRDAAEKFASGALHAITIPQTGLPITGWVPWRPFVSMNVPRPASPRWWTTVTPPRRHHHLQQLAGRGH